MSSQQKDGTSYPPSEPKPCANNCGFFGIAENRNLCSKCYRDLCLQEAHQSASKSKFYQSATVASAAAPSPDDAAAKPSSSAESSVDQADVSKVVNRCGCCNKKVGLTGFMCRCGVTFCGTHRYPEKHECSYDFKTTGRNAISKANPIVKADKVQKF